MANNWPDGGEPELSRGEKVVMGFVGVALIAALVSGALILVTSVIGPQPSVILVAIACAIGLAVGLLWVRPWETEPPKPRRRR